MSGGEDDTFDIDIYGEDVARQNTSNGGTTNGHSLEQATGDYTNGQADGNGSAGPTDHEAQNSADTTTPAQQQQGTKRKADEYEDLYDGEANDSYNSNNQIQPSEWSDSATIIPSHPTPTNTNGHQRTSSAPTNPNATPALHFSDLNWWTTEEDLRAYCAAAGLDEKTQLRELRIGEHTQNGKSRGEAYLEFDSPKDAEKVKKQVESANGEQQNGAGVRKTPVTVEFIGVGNFLKGSSGGGDKGSGYNSYNNRGGGFRGDRGGRGGFQNRGNFGGRGGFGNQGRGGYQQGGQNQGGWGMNGAANPAMGGFGNPMMAGFGGMGMPGMNMGMGMGGFGGGMNMGRGGQGMMGMNRGGGGMMPNMMGNMMGRGGWGGGGFQQGAGMGQQGFGGSPGPVQQNKRGRFQ